MYKIFGDQVQFLCLILLETLRKLKISFSSKLLVCYSFNEVIAFSMKHSVHAGICLRKLAV